LKVTSSKQKLNITKDLQGIGCTDGKWTDGFQYVQVVSFDDSVEPSGQMKAEYFRNS
jgi:hypothetical protein